MQALRERMQRAIIGQERVVERLIIGLLADGHLLVEGLPGLAKTRAIKALAANLEAEFSRVQFTPDLLPSDITGTEVFYRSDDHGEFRFEAGPVFANIVLGDEINRAPAKVQAAMLEAMEERQVTVAGNTHPLPALYLVMATQNPIEQEGTYPLPEAQMDRFLMHVRMDYPALDDELRIMDLVREEERLRQQGAQTTARPEGDRVAGEASAGQGAASVAGERTGQAAVFAARAEIAELHVAEALKRYIADLVQATRRPQPLDAELASWIDVGASPRGSIALDRCSRARAWLQGRDYVDPEDVRAVLHDCLRHRLVLSYEAQGEAVDPDQVIDRLLARVALP